MILIRIYQLIKLEIQGPSSLAGYRYLWHALRLKHHVNVPRNLVATIMKEIDPGGVKKRRSRRLKRRFLKSQIIAGIETVSLV